MRGFDAAWNQTVNLHEFQSKKLFAGYGIPVPFGYAVETAKEARSAAEDMGGDRWIVKAQAHTGGRGKAGGVVLVDSPDKVESESKRILSDRMSPSRPAPAGCPSAISWSRSRQILQKSFTSVRWSTARPAAYW